ncbi:MAG: signal peptide peptidase SppA [Bacteroidales bacterium]|nr:signal peptide peptidase SppA [Candidatus Cacconaster caballi]
MKTFWKIFFGALLGCIAAFIILTFLGIGMLGSLVASLSAGEKETVAIGNNTILKIDFSTPVTEQSTETFNFSLGMTGTSSDVSSSISLFKAVQAIDKAADDPSIQYIYMTPAQINMSLATAEEFRTALSRFRAKGKAIVADLQYVDIMSYYMASVADKVIVNPYADIMISGLSSPMMFYKDLIDRLGLDIQLIRHGKFKSAGEPFIRNDISPENRRQTEEMLLSVWDALADAICSSRDFSKSDLNGWIDNLAIGNVEAAREKGLVDELWYRDEVVEYLCTLSGVEKEKELKFVTLPEYASKAVKPDYKTKDKIAVIYANGEIVMGDSSDGYIGDTFAKEIEKARRDSSVKAVVFRVNSPGGSVQASAIIQREIELLRAVKPVVASYGDYAASGGYWISCACDKIFSDRTTLTGSIGVFGLIPSFSGALKKNLHINMVEVATHRHGSLINGFFPLDGEETAYMRDMIEDVYTKFTSLVAGSRNMSVEAVDEIAQGRVWAGGDALGIGLVDEIGTLSDAVSYAAAAVSLDKYQIVEYPVEKTMYERFMEKFQKSGAKASEAPLDAVQKATLWLTGINGPAVEARIPYMLEIK